MSVLVLGSIAFEALMLIGFSGNGKRVKYASQETIEGLPALQRLQSKEPRRPRLTVRVHPSLGDARPWLAALDAASGEGVLPLQFGNGALIGWFVIEDIEPEYEVLFADGTPLSGVVHIQLNEARTPASLGQDQQFGIAANAPAQRTTPAPIDVDRDPEDVTLSEALRA